MSYTFLVIGILLLPAILNGAADLTRRPVDLPLYQHLRSVGDSISRQVARQAFALACLPYEAFISLEAIGRTVVRMLVTGRRLLEWRTAHDAQRNACPDIAGYYASMWVQPIVATLAALALGLLRADALAVAGTRDCALAGVAGDCILVESAGEAPPTQPDGGRSGISGKRRPAHLAVL